jgi:hypothetical protein
MIKQDWMAIHAGAALVDALTEETKARCAHTGAGYASEALVVVQREQAARGIVGVELVKSNYGWSVRYDSGLQDFGIVASAQRGQVDGSWDSAVRFALDWVAQDPAKRYAWSRK